ncbi:uncharacterized protein LOC117652655 [Thrips palmi]|uniref:Uncharacterized protein LOC117652655 n=1 Tax=Thrips palmi TaxID=161013 RepID=A0A6P9A8N1_THRPL|nr:uncharacterized protein LOC117652655 [Thrips palmi]
MDTIRGKQENSLLYHFHDGFFFHLNKTANETHYYRCTLWKQGCPVRANLKPDGIFRTNFEHNHLADPSQAGLMTERLALINEARRLDVATVRDAFLDVQNLGFAGELNFHSLYPAMTRARESSWPHVQNLSELCDVLENPTYACITALDHFVDSIFGGVSHGRFGPVVLFMTNKSNEFLKMIPTVIILCSPITVGTQQYKLYTIATDWEGNVIPAALILVETETHDTVVAGFTMLRDTVGTWNLSLALCGIPGVAHAFQEVFAVNVKPSLLDYIYDIKAFMKQQVSPATLNGNAQLMNILVLCSALPVIPKELLQMSINIIINEAVSGEVYSDATRLFNYLEMVWIQHANFTMCDVVRTSFSSVDLKRSLERTFKDFYSLIRFNRSLFEKSCDSIHKVYNGQRLQYKTRAVLSDERVVNLLKAPLSPVAASNLLHAVAEKISHLDTAQHKFPTQADTLGKSKRKLGLAIIFFEHQNKECEDKIYEVIKE